MTQKAISVSHLYNKKRNVMNFTGDWEKHIGKPEITGSWIIWGNSGNGKTDYALKLAKYLTNFTSVYYNPLEERDSQSLANACQRNYMHECKRGRFLIILDDIEELTNRLNKSNSANVVIVDSLQYTGINYNRYKELLKAFPSKLFIWISHAEGKSPSGRVASKIRYDAFVKIFVESYMAYPMSRFGGDKPYVIWEDKARELGVI